MVVNFRKQVSENKAFKGEMPSQPLSEAGRREAMEVFIRQAKIYLGAGQWDKACLACHDAIAAAPDVAETHKLVGNIYQELGEGADALGYYGRALLANPSYPEVYANLGSFYARQQSWEDAERYYRKAIALRPEFAPFYRPLALVLEAAGKVPEATEIFAQAVSLDPQASGAEHYRAGNFFLGQGDALKAIQSYRRAVESEGGCLEACEPLADLLEKQGDWQAATRYYRQAFEAGLAQPPGAIAADTGADTNNDPVSSAPVSNEPVSNEPVSNGSVAAAILPGHANGQSDGRNNSGQINNGQINNSQMNNGQMNNGQKHSGQPPHGEYRMERISTPRRLRSGQAQSKRVIKIIRSSASEAVVQAAAQVLPIASTPLPSAEPGHAAGPAPVVAALDDLAQPAQPLAESDAAVPTEQDWQLAIANCQASLAQNPNQPAVYRDLARALTKAQRLDEAAQAWYQALHLEPNWASPQQHCHLGDRLANQGKLEQAVACYNLAIQRDNQFMLAYDHLAHVLELQKAQGELL